MLLEDKQLFKFGVVMTVIYMMFLVLFFISLVLVLDQLQGKNLKKWSYLSKKSRIEENTWKEAKGKKMRNFQSADHNLSYEYRNEVRDHVLES